MSKFSEFIQRNTALVTVDGRAAHNADPGQEFETALTTGSKCPLLSFGLVCFTGRDVQEFVNGQFTTNCTEITPGRSQFSAWCDPKGRVLFLFTLYTDGERIFAILPRQQITNYMQRLQMYIMRSDVQLEDVSSAYAIFGFTPETADETNTTAPNELWATVQPSPATIEIRHGPGRSRFITIGDDSAAIERWEAMNLPIIGEDAWTGLECLGGLPRLDEKSSGQYLPQNLNLDRLDSLSFSKGCFPGQEIIARLKYRGEVKKRLMVASYDSDTAPDPRSPIRSDNDERSVGHVLYAQRVSPAQSIVSAVVEIGAWGEHLIVEDGSVGQLNRIDLPYDLD